jgi:hypothetical protein
MALKLRLNIHSKASQKVKEISAKDLSCVYKAELKSSYWNMHTFMGF